jgi:hypothetical protein
MFSFLAPVVSATLISLEPYSRRPRRLAKGFAGAPAAFEIRGVYAAPLVFSQGYPPL